MPQQNITHGQGPSTKGGAVSRVWLKFKDLFPPKVSGFEKFKDLFPFKVSGSKPKVLSTPLGPAHTEHLIRFKWGSRRWTVGFIVPNLLARTPGYKKNLKNATLSGEANKFHKAGLEMWISHQTLQTVWKWNFCLKNPFQIHYHSHSSLTVAIPSLLSSPNSFCLNQSIEINEIFQLIDFWDEKLPPL